MEQRSNGNHISLSDYKGSTLLKSYDAEPLEKAEKLKYRPDKPESEWTADEHSQVADMHEKIASDAQKNPANNDNRFAKKIVDHNYAESQRHHDLAKQKSTTQKPEGEQKHANDNKVQKSVAYDILGINDDVIEKATKGKHHAKHKYLKIEDGKYIYDYDKMTNKDHEAAVQHHKEKAKEAHQHYHKLNASKDPREQYDQVPERKKALLERQYHEDLTKKHDKLAKQKEREEGYPSTSKLKFKGELDELSSSAGLASHALESESSSGIDEIMDLHSYISSNFKNFTSKQFDWKDEDKADNWLQKQESQGKVVFDYDDGGDMFCLFAVDKSEEKKVLALNKKFDLHDKGFPIIRAKI